MKRIIRAFFMCFGMFTAIPCPYRPWDEEARPLMVACLPLVGLVIGGIWSGIWLLLEVINSPHFLTAAILTLVPYVLTGFIHLDGFMDTCDAVLSRRNLEERQRILKDPHVGSFGVICLGMLFLICFALFSSVDTLQPWRVKALIFIPVASRSCAALAVSCLRPIGHSQYSGAYRKGIRRSQIAAQGAALALSLAAAYLISGKGVAAVAGAAIGYGLGVYYGFRQLNGMSGDISGFSLVLGEAIAIAVLMVM